MKKIFLLFILFLIPFTVNAKAVDIYLFYGAECSYCHQEREYLNILEKKYHGNINVQEYEVWHNKKNNKLFTKVQKELKDKNSGVPYTVIADTSIIGYKEQMNMEIEKLINDNLKINKTNTVTSILKDQKIKEEKNKELTFPFIGNIKVTEFPLFGQTFLLVLSAIISPNGLFVLLFMASFLLVIKKRYLFLIPFFSAILFMNILFILNIFTLNNLLLTIIKTIIALVPISIGALILGQYMKQMENKKSKLEFISNHPKILFSLYFVLGLIISFIFYPQTASYINLLNISMNINDNITFIYPVIYLLIFILLLYLMVILFNKIFQKLPKTYISSFIILIIIGLILVFWPNLVMFTS